MSQALPSIVYLLCLGTSLACFLLLLRSWRRSRMRLLLWSALCFAGLALTNLILFVDLVLLPDIDLQVPRALLTLAALAVLLFGFVWETD